MAHRLPCTETDSIGISILGCVKALFGSRARTLDLNEDQVASDGGAAAGEKGVFSVPEKAEPSQSLPARRAAEPQVSSLPDAARLGRTSTICGPPPVAIVLH
jgi:hypothetical protein